jgi:hypothetical protein
MKTKSKKSAHLKKPSITPEERQKMIEVAAYRLAEKKGFQGDPAKYWAEAEKMVDTISGILRESPKDGA